MSVTPDFVGLLYRFHPLEGEATLAVVRQVNGSSMVSMIEDDGSESKPIPVDGLIGRLEGPLGYAAEGGSVIASAPATPRWVLIPPVVYRYMPQQFIDEFFATGRLRLSSFAVFKGHADEQRGDPLEGINLVSGASDPLTIIASVHHGQNSLVLSTSVRGDASLMRQFNCDGYFRIVDTHLFGQAIARHIPGYTDGLEGFCNYKDAHVIRRKFAAEAALDPTSTPSQHDLQLASETVVGLAGFEGFFSKRREFEHQVEYRLIWNLNREIEQCEFVNCREAIQFCERIT
jgi:hypothetical protein